MILNCVGPFLEHIFGRCFIKKPIFSNKKMKNDFSVQIKFKVPKANLFAIPICTHLHNMGLFEQTIP
jgi:hypothetical protein